MRTGQIACLLIVTMASAATGPTLAGNVLISTASPAAVDGPGPSLTSFGDGDVVRINTIGIGTIFLLAETINPGGLPDLNAAYVTPGGSLIFSTQSGAAGYDFDDDELVQYDPGTGTLSLFYDFGGLITTGADVDIDGFHILDNGNYLISNTSDFTLDSQDFTNGDIVMFDPLSATASLFFSESLFEGTDDIWVRSVSLRANGNLVLSAFNETTGGSMTLGGVTFGRGDLVEYNIATGIGSLFLDSAVFGGATEDIDAVHVVPLPAAGWLLVSALALLGRRAIAA